MKSNTNTVCANCAAAWNGLNGRYCGALERYVEQAIAIPPCRYMDHDNASGESETGQDTDGGIY